jgi:hypothetical protein
MMNTRDTWRLAAYLAASTGFSAEEIRNMDLEELVLWAKEVAEHRKQSR